MKWIALTAALLALLAFAGLACSGNDDAAGPEDESSGTIEVLLTDDLAIEPARIELDEGTPVKLLVKNTGQALHDFSVETIPVTGVSPEEDGGGHEGMDSTDEYDLHIAVEGGDEGVLEFTPTESGEFEVVCTVTGHADAGMIGTLVVS
jgi:uncharacterized cupredoxin-like copper-binding protein